MGNLICKKNTAWAPKNGNSIILLYHRWIPNNPPLRQLVQGPLTWKDETATIFFVWDNHNWNWDALDMYIPQNIKENANNITVNPDPSNINIPYWTGNSNGYFSTKSVHQTLILIPFHLTSLTGFGKEIFQIKSNSSFGYVPIIDFQLTLSYIILTWCL